MKEILVWGYRGYLTGNFVINSEVSNDEGIFQTAHAWVNSETEAPAIMTRDAYLSPDKCKRMTEKDKARYFSIIEQINNLRQELKTMEANTLTQGLPVTWDWMKQHQKPTVKTPEPYQSKKLITSKRKGSRVIVSTSLSSWHRWVGTVGKLRRFNRNNALIELADGRRVRVPYAYLKPCNPESKAQAKKEKRNAEIGAKIVNGLNKALKQ